MASENKNNIGALDDVIDDDLTDELAPLRTAGDGTAELFGLDPTVVEREERILALESDLEQRDEAVRDLQSRLEDAAARAEEMARCIAERDEAAAALRSDLSAALDRLDAQQSRLDEALEADATLRQTLTEREQRLAEAEAERAELATALDRSTGEAESLRDTLTRLQEDNRRSEAERRSALGSLADRRGRTARKLARAESIRRSLERELSRLQAENRLLNQTIVASSRPEPEAAAQERQAAQRAADDAHREQRIEELSARVTEARMAAAELGRRIRERDDRITDLEQSSAELGERLRAAESARSAADEELARLRSAATDGERRAGELSRRCEALMEEKESLLADAGSLREALDAARSGLLEAEEARTQLLTETEERSGELESVWRELCERDQALDRERSSRECLEASMTELREKLEERDERIAGDAATIDELRRQLGETEQELTTALDANHSLRQEIERLRDDVEQLTSVGSSPVPADPESVDGATNEHEHEDGAVDARMGRSLVTAMNGREIRYPLFRSRITIGRTSVNDIQLKTPFVSRSHAVIFNDAERVQIVDLGSKNGLYVNGERRSRADLNAGDRLLIGDTEFEYQEMHRH
ncbi:MAG: FHA domain-containing protein [Gammaproteobacteria bacterium]